MWEKKNWQMELRPMYFAPFGNETRNYTDSGVRIDGVAADL